MGSLIRSEERLNSQGNLSILDHPVMLMSNPARDGYFQQDSAPCHAADIFRRWFDEPDRVYLFNHQISIQLRICGMKLNGTSNSWIQKPPI
ncbi:hypothetical protein TNCV_3778821 [Trichonephila clavipes]|nr:hypothetical protein TNCV_3778821 [Trichonephila clavipes]